MTVKELIEKLNQVPENALVYVESDHGQCSEHAGDIEVCFDNNTPFYGEDLEWEVLEEDIDTHDIKSIKIR